MKKLHDHFVMLLSLFALASCSKKADTVVVSKPLLQVGKAISNSSTLTAGAL